MWCWTEVYATIKLTETVADDGVEICVRVRFGVFDPSAELNICFLIEPLSDLFGRGDGALLFFSRIIICCCNGVP